MSIELDHFLSALALLLVLEGLLPCLSPQHWRASIRKLMLFSDDKVRMGGLIAMLVGAVILFVIHA